MKKDLEEGGFAAIKAIEDKAGGVPDYDKRVEAIFEETLAQLPKAEQRALEYAALLPADVVVRGWLWELLKEDDEVDLPESPGIDRPAMAVVDLLTRRTLLHPIDDHPQLMSLHRLLRRHINDQLAADDELFKKMLDKICDLTELRGKKSQDAITDKKIRWELSPLLALSERLRELGRVNIAIDLASRVCTSMIELGRFDESRASFTSFLVPTGEVMKGISFEKAASIHSNLAVLLEPLGDQKGAIKQIEQAIAIGEKHFDSDHPHLAVLYSNLAVTLRSLGDMQGACKHMERSIEISKMRYNADDLKLAVSYSNLSTILYELGNLQSAYEHIVQAIEIEEKNLKPDNPSLAINYSILSIVLKDLGDLQGARKQLERAIRIDEKHFESDNPKLAIRYNNLAFIELADEKKEEACRLWRQAYAIWKKHFNNDHPNVRHVVRVLEKYCRGMPEVK